MEESAALLNEILVLLRTALHPCTGALPSCALSSSRFEALAQRVLRYQHRQNPRLETYLTTIPDRTFDPFVAPPVPTEAFKYVDLMTFDPSESKWCFCSSGTTAKRSRHHLRRLDLMKASIEAPFKAFVIPDLDAIDMLIAMPSFQSLPDSSLAFMLSHVGAQFGKNVTHVIANEKLDGAGAITCFERVCRAGVPLLMLAPASGHWHLLDALERRGVRMVLPEGSRVFETGGFKRHQKAGLDRSTLHRRLEEILGIDQALIVGEYSMSEISSQLYEPTIRCRLGNHQYPRVYVPPPWCAVRVVDPATLQPVPIGVSGAVTLFDLANVESAAFVLTGDIGRLVPTNRASDYVSLPHGAAGLELQGRSHGADEKGCSMALDALLSEAAEGFR